jgi:hypothetical protein
MQRSGDLQRRAEILDIDELVDERLVRERPPELVIQR